MVGTLFDQTRCALFDHAFRWFVFIYLLPLGPHTHTPSVVVPHIQNSFNPHTSQNEGVAVGMYRIGWNIIHLNCVRSRNISAGMCSHVFFARPRAERKRTPVRPAGLATSLLFPRYTHTHTHTDPFDWSISGTVYLAVVSVMLPAKLSRTKSD